MHGVDATVTHQPGVMETGYTSTRGDGDGLSWSTRGCARQESDTILDTMA